MMQSKSSYNWVQFIGNKLINKSTTSYIVSEICMFKMQSTNNNNNNFQPLLNQK